MQHEIHAAPRVANLPQSKQANTNLFYPDYTVGFGLEPNPAAMLEQNTFSALPLVGCTTDREFLRARAFASRKSPCPEVLFNWSDSINNDAARQILALALRAPPRHQYTFHYGDDEIHAQIHEN